MSRQHLLSISDGDARSMLNTLELAATAATPDQRGQASYRPADPRRRRPKAVAPVRPRRRWALRRDFRPSSNLSAIRTRWFALLAARMLEAGEDPLYVVRRVIRMASEDIGLADPHALGLCMAAQQAAHFVGMPECELALAQAVVYLALAPKSNALYTAYSAVKQDVAGTRNEPVPMHLRNAPTGLMKDLGYGKGYKYAHDFEARRSSKATYPTLCEAGAITAQPTEVSSRGSNSE